RDRRAGLLRRGGSSSPDRQLVACADGDARRAGSRPTRDQEQQKAGSDGENATALHLRMIADRRGIASSFRGTTNSVAAWASDASMSVKSPVAVRVRVAGRACGRGSA